MTDEQRRPDEFLDRAREITATAEAAQGKPVADPAKADQILAASRDARRIMEDSALAEVFDRDISEREIAFGLALASAADRRRVPTPLGSPRPGVVDLTAQSQDRQCDVCETHAFKLNGMRAQYGPYIFKARVCNRCRRFITDEPGADDERDAA